MSVKKGDQLDSIPKMPKDLFQVSFNLDKQDQFVTSLAVSWEHWKGIPTPIGLKDRGSYRTSQQLDTISSNGMIFNKAGCFSGAMVGNSSNKSSVDGGEFDNAVARLILPRFYDSQKDKRIYLCVGDRVYLKDVEALVSNYQLIQRDPASNVDVLQYPAKCVEILIDNTGKNYTVGFDFEVTSQGNIRWLKNTPAIDPDTGLGAVYSIRYLYQAHWYIQSLPNEVRVSQVTTNGERKPERMPYSAVIVREYIYHNKNNSEETAANNDPRKQEKPKESIDTSQYSVKVSMDDVE